MKHENFKISASVRNLESTKILEPPGGTPNVFDDGESNGDRRIPPIHQDAEIGCGV
jgi:hypothetical protein